MFCVFFLLVPPLLHFQEQRESQLGPEDGGDRAKEPRATLDTCQVGGLVPLLHALRLPVAPMRPLASLRARGTRPPGPEVGPRFCSHL